jgi:hypothetical protein
MSSVTHIVRIIGAWVLCAAATVCLFVAMPLALPLYVGSLAFAHLPE